MSFFTDSKSYVIIDSYGPNIANSLMLVSHWLINSDMAKKRPSKKTVILLSSALKVVLYVGSLVASLTGKLSNENSPLLCGSGQECIKISA